MSTENRWAKQEYPSGYRKDVESSIDFSGLRMDMFVHGKANDAIDLLRIYGNGSSADAAFLDIGCGIGVSHPLLISHVSSLSGSDVSQDAIEMARVANFAVDYRVLEGNRLPFENESFDFCSTVCVMHHVPVDQWPAFVAEAWRVTKPGGLFAVYEHNPVNPMTRWAVWRCPFDHDAVLLGTAKVRELLRDQGFEIVTQRYLFFMPFDRPWARRFDRLLRWLPLGAQYVVCGRRPIGSESTGVQDPT